MAPNPADPDCIFCKIVQGEIPSTTLYTDGRVIAFEDISPSAPVHLLVIPVDHVTFLTGLDEASEALIGHMALVGRNLAHEHGIDDSGYRLVINQGSDAGQMVDHLHMHLLGGRPLGGLAS